MPDLQKTYTRTLSEELKVIGFDIAVFIQSVYNSENSDKHPFDICVNSEYDLSNEVGNYRITIKTEEPSSVHSYPSTQPYITVSEIICVLGGSTPAGFQFENVDKNFVDVIKSAIKLHDEKYNNQFFYASKDETLDHNMPGQNKKNN